VGCEVTPIVNYKTRTMKFLPYILMFFSLTAFMGCAKEEDIISTETEVGRSKIVFFPEITTKGERLLILQQGKAYTEQGATAVLNNKPTDFTTTGAVDVTKPGVYDITYEAKNEQGFSVDDFRTVVVIGSDVDANDFSGTYLRAATGITSTWTKTAPGVYTVENPGGAGVGAGLKVIAVNYTGNKIAIPHQISPDFGSVSSGNETYNSGPPATISYVFFAGGYGTALRTFVKQ
jgi:hypothetical protein